MSRNISLDSVVVASGQQIHCDLAGEAAILNMKNGVYYGLDPVGARIWNLLQEPRTVRAIRETILEEYAVESKQCERDLLALLENLQGEGLIEVNNAGPS